ncbi:Ig domain-containing protein, partial [Geomonas sp.]|uniref:Ig domain-containing protein n=1 Tax=Geomonas sp. TaxID=2651584 RepID=UPI002B47C0BE
MKKLIACLITLGLLIIAACSDNNPSDLVMLSNALPDGTAGAPYSQTLLATGGTIPYTWRVDAGALPVGLSLSPAGVISGTPTSAGTSTFTATVVDAGVPPQIRSRSFTLTINQPGALTITSTSPLPGGTVSSAYSQTLTATGGTTPYSWAVTAGALPAGLSLNASTGLISGTPTTAGTANFTVTVTDSAVPTAATASTAFALTIAAAGTPVSITTTSPLPAAATGAAYTTTLVAANGVTPYTWAVTTGTLPAGLSLNASTGVISGTPTTAGTSNFTVTVTDSTTPTAGTASTPFALTVSASGPAAPANAL